MTRARKRRLSSAPSNDWQLVHATAGPEPSAAQSFGIGVVLPSNYTRFAQDCTSETGVDSMDDSSLSVETVGLLASGRIVKMRVDSLQKADVPTRTDAVALAESISRACSECRCSSDAAAEETVARSFLSRIQAFGVLNFPTFESIFDQICAVCFNHQLEDSLRAVFLQAFHCICSFKSFQTRILSGRGPLALISLLHSCRSCLTADLVLNCINAITANKSNSSKLACPELIEALLSAVDMHVSAAPKVNALLERWYRLCSLPCCCTTSRLPHPHTLWRRLQLKGGKKLVIECSVVNRLAAQIQSFNDTPALASSIRLLRRIMITEAPLLLSFVESQHFCESSSDSNPVFLQMQLIGFLQVLHCAALV
jgi:hypothetical protein